MFIFSETLGIVCDSVNLFNSFWTAKVSLWIFIVSTKTIWQIEHEINGCWWIFVIWIVCAYRIDIPQDSLSFFRYFLWILWTFISSLEYLNYVLVGCNHDHDDKNQRQIDWCVSFVVSLEQGHHRLSSSHPHTEESKAALCRVCHIPYSKSNIPFPIKLSRCAICRSVKSLSQSGRMLHRSFRGILQGLFGILLHLPFSKSYRPNLSSI